MRVDLNVQLQGGQTRELQCATLIRVNRSYREGWSLGSAPDSALKQHLVEDIFENLPGATCDGEPISYNSTITNLTGPWLAQLIALQFASENIHVTPISPLPAIVSTGDAQTNGHDLSAAVSTAWKTGIRHFVAEPYGLLSHWLPLSYVANVAPRANGVVLQTIDGRKFEYDFSQHPIPELCAYDGTRHLKPVPLNSLRTGVCDAVALMEHLGLANRLSPTRKSGDGAQPSLLNTP